MTIMVEEINSIPVRITQHNAIGNKVIQEPLVLLHGWGADERSWKPILTQLTAFADVLTVKLPGFGLQNLSLSNQQSLDDFLQALAEQLPARVALLGWSLGGMLAVQFAQRFPERCAHVMTMAANLSFVVRDDWPMGVDKGYFLQFCKGFRRDPELTLKRFSISMGLGDSSARALGKLLHQKCVSSYHDAGDPDTSWLGALKLLGTLDNRAAYTALKVPGLHILADNDDLVPVAIAEQLKSLNSSQQVVVVEDSSHAPHWSKPQQVLGVIESFLIEGQYQVDKRRVAESFGRAASSYDSVAQLQRDIGNELLNEAKTAQSDNQLWLDLGAGTGYFSPKIKQKVGDVLCLDLSEGMLKFAREQHREINHWLCADGEQLPLADHCMDGLFSSLAIQWCSRLPLLFGEIKRVLKPGSSIIIATLGPKTLYEMREAWQQVDDYTHVNRFASKEQVLEAITGAGFDDIGWRTEYKVLRYDELKQLTYELKTLGAHNMNHGQSSGLTGRQRVKKFRQAYEQFRDENNQLPATYEVFYIELTA